jgi:hypothetical protein
MSAKRFSIEAWIGKRNLHRKAARHNCCSDLLLGYGAALGICDKITQPTSKPLPPGRLWRYQHGGWAMARDVLRVPRHTHSRPTRPDFRTR